MIPKTFFIELSMGNPDSDQMIYRIKFIHIDINKETQMFN